MQLELNSKLSAKITEMMADQDQINNIVACLEDGSIDKGDYEEVSDKLMDLVKGLQEYQDLNNYMKENLQAYVRLYKQLGEGTPADYDAYIEMTERVAQETAVNSLFDTLIQLGVVKDNREAPAHEATSIFSSTKPR